jgi:hypothetical protein
LYKARAATARKVRTNGMEWKMSAEKDPELVAAR